MKNLSRGFASIVVLIGIVIVLAAAGGYWWWQNKARVAVPLTTQQATSSQQTTMDVTANWKTYQDEKRGFEFRYPPEYKLDTMYKDELGTIDVDPAFHSLSNPSKKTSIRWTVEAVHSNYCYLEHCQEVAKGNLVLGDLAWHDFGLEHYCDAGACSPETHTYGIAHGEYNYYIIFTDEDRAEKILQTFKFTK